MAWEVYDGEDSDVEAVLGADLPDLPILVVYLLV